mgnify:CR=1 FL=1
MEERVCLESACQTGTHLDHWTYCLWPRQAPGNGPNAWQGIREFRKASNALSQAINAPEQPVQPPVPQQPAAQPAVTPVQHPRLLHRLRLQLGRPMHSRYSRIPYRLLHRHSLLEQLLLSHLPIRHRRRRACASSWRPRSVKQSRKRIEGRAQCCALFQLMDI